MCLLLKYPVTRSFFRASIDWISACAGCSGVPFSLLSTLLMSSSTSELTALIQTKLQRPLITIDLVPSPRLISWLDERRQRPITLVFGNAWRHCGSSLTVPFKKNLDLMKTIRRRIKRPIWCVVLPVINLCNGNKPPHPLDAGLPDLSFPG